MTVGESVNAAVIVVEDDSDVVSVDVTVGGIENVRTEGVPNDDAVTLTVNDLEDTNDADANVEGEFETLGLAVDVVVVDCELLADGDFDAPRL